MIRLEEQEQRSVAILKSDPNFYKFVGILQKELDTTISGLMKATPDKVQVLQGRSQLLTELINLGKT